jgi:deoxycytidine triphosphate deaminase
MGSKFYTLGQMVMRDDFHTLLRIPEMINCTRKHVLQIKPGQSIGQVVFFEHEPVPEEFSYRRMGQYNGQRGVTASKGLR